MLHKAATSFSPFKLQHLHAHVRSALNLNLGSNATNNWQQSGSGLGAGSGSGAANASGSGGAGASSSLGSSTSQAGGSAGSAKWHAGRSYGSYVSLRAFGVAIEAFQASSYCQVLEIWRLQERVLIVLLLNLSTVYPAIQTHRRTVATMLQLPMRLLPPMEASKINC